MSNGCVRARVIGAAVFGAILFLAACGGQHSNPLPSRTVDTSKTTTVANGAAGNSVSVFADNSDELAARIDAAIKAGLHPKFIQVTAGKRNYLFPVYAQVLRSQRGLLVRAYSRIYVYRLDSVHVKYATQDVQLSQLPQVAATLLDGYIAAGRQPGLFNVNSKAKLKICPDCTELLLYQPQVLKLASAWNGKLDFWQTDPEYVPWAPTASALPGRRTMCTVGGSTIACVYSHCSNCYTSTGYSPNDSPATGGGSVASNPTPSPTPCSQTNNSTINNLENSDSSLKKAMTTLSNLGYKPNIVSTSMPGTPAKYDQASGNILWDQSQVNTATGAPYNQDAGQIAFHEADHDYNDHNWNFTIPANGLVTVTIGSYTVQYNLTTPNGAAGFEHMLIHNDLVAMYGSDKTGAAYEMFGDFGQGDLNDPNVTVSQQGGGTVDRAAAGNNNRTTSVAHTTGPATSFASAIASHGSACAGSTTTAATRTTMFGYGGSSVYRPTPIPQPTATAATATLARPADFGEIYQ